MEVLAALGDAPTAAIAVVAIVIGVLLAARGPREKRAAGDMGGQEEAGPTLLKVPVSAAPEAEPGFVGPAGEVVGHGPIRLGAPGSLGAPAPSSRAGRARAASGGIRAAARGVARRPPDEPKDAAWVAARAANSAVPPGHDQGRWQARHQAQGRVGRKRARRRDRRRARDAAPSAGRAAGGDDCGGYAASRSPASASSPSRLRMAASSSWRARSRVMLSSRLVASIERSRPSRRP